MKVAVIGAERLLSHGDPLGGGTPNGEPLKFYNDVVLSYEGKDCLIWPFARKSNGYAHVWVQENQTKLDEIAAQYTIGFETAPSWGLLALGNPMIGMNLHHKDSGISGTVDAEVTHPDGAAMVRIRDMWFDAQSLIPA